MSVLGVLLLTINTLGWSAWLWGMWNYDKREHPGELLWAGIAALVPLLALLVAYAIRRRFIDESARERGASALGASIPFSALALLFLMWVTVV
jgi:hypothetical protein